MAVSRRGIAISRRETDFSSSFLEFIYYMKRILDMRKTRFVELMLKLNISSTGKFSVYIGTHKAAWQPGLVTEPGG